MSLVERCFWCDELDPYGTHRCDKEWTMTDFTREDMRERIAREIGGVTSDQDWTFRRLLSDNEQRRIVDAIIDELGLWEVYEKAEAFLAAWTASDGSEVRYGRALRTYSAAIELGRELRNLRGE